MERYDIRQGEWRAEKAEAGDFVLFADAQATIAALQARVKELEEWKRIVTGAGTDQESVIRLAAYEYTKIAVQCWKEANAKLESQLTQRTAECYALKLVNDTHMKTVMKLSHIVEQQTAELEAIEKILDIDSGKTTVEKVRDLHHSFKQVWESYQDASNEMFKAQAELERVRGELERAEAGYFVAERDLRGMNNKYDELREQNRVLRNALQEIYEGRWTPGVSCCYEDDARSIYPTREMRIRSIAQAALIATSQPGGTHEL